MKINHLYIENCFNEMTTFVVLLFKSGSMTIQDRVAAFIELGKMFDQVGSVEKNTKHEYKVFIEKLDTIISKAKAVNPWFTERNILEAFREYSKLLKPEKLDKWLSAYPEINENKAIRRIGVIMSGNIPMVGFHDLLCVLISGNIFVGKLSSKDKLLLKLACSTLIDIDSRFKERIVFYDDKLKDFDAVIATGSDNSSRYFDYYFEKYPNIIRKNRNSVAIISGNETNEELKNLADDIFRYFGLGCRNVSKIFVPDGYDFTSFFPSIEHYSFVRNHNKYANNYEYNRSIWLMNIVPHLDNGFLLVKEDSAISSPIACLFYEFYTSVENVLEKLKTESNNIQCVVSASDLENTIKPGKSQQPELWDYADNRDTLKFLLNLS